MHSLTSAVEPLSLANRELGFDAYEWLVVSSSATEVESSAGMVLHVDGNLSSSRNSDHIIICDGDRAKPEFSNSVLSRLRHHHAVGGIVGSLGNGAFALAEAGLLENKPFTVHWQNYHTMAENYPNLDIQDRLYVIDNRLITSAGSAAAADLALELIARDFGPRLANRISELCVRSPKREADERQRSHSELALATGNEILSKAVFHMQENLEDPIKLEDLANHAGVSRRQLERVFKKHVGKSPAEYYREIRIEHARKLITETNLPIIEIIFASGFESPSAFNKNFRQKYGCTPSKVRENYWHSQFSECHAE